MSFSMSRTLGVGTPPTSRRVSPAPRRRSSTDHCGSVVPFKRSNSASRLADTQSNTFERSFRPSAPSQSQSQPVPLRQSFPRYTLDGQTLQRGQPVNSFVAPAKPIDSPFRQEGFATDHSHDVVERDSQAVLASVPESPNRTKSKGLLSQQLSREASSSLTSADVKVQLVLFFVFVCSCSVLLSLALSCRGLWRHAMVCPQPCLPASRLQLA